MQYTFQTGWTRKYTKVLQEWQNSLLRCLGVPQSHLLVFVSDL